MADAFKPCIVPGCNNNSGVKGTARGYCRSHYKRWMRHGDPLLGGTRMNSRPKWIEENKSHAGDDCLAWPFSKTDSGYGQFKVRGKSTLASRAMCIAAHGSPPSEEHQAAHSCGNGHLGCVNPRHLYWATPKRNASDRLVHGTHIRGRQQWCCRLTESEVIEIRQSKLSETRLSLIYGVNRAQIGRIRRREQWAWLKDAA